jgi:hypothetical protein
MPDSAGTECGRVRRQRRALKQKAPMRRIRAIGTASEKAAPKNNETKLGTAISRSVTAPSDKAAPSAK